MGKIIFTALIAIVIIVIFYFGLGSRSGGYTILNDFNGEINFYKSQSCGCCSVYEGYLRSKGDLIFKTNNVENIAPIKSKYGIPNELQSCHTLVIGNYFVEGHIPLEAIEKLIKEKPDIAGIAMPGMPSGSPGMPGAKKGDFVIYAVNKDGSSKEFMRI